MAGFEKNGPIVVDRRIRYADEENAPKRSGKAELHVVNLAIIDPECAQPKALN